MSLLDAAWELQRQLTGLSLSGKPVDAKIIRNLADDALLIHAEIRRQQRAKEAQQSSDQGSGEVDAQIRRDFIAYMRGKTQGRHDHDSDEDVILFHMEAWGAYRAALTAKVKP